MHSGAGKIPAKVFLETPEMGDHTFQHYGTNLSDEGNYLIMEAEGSGQFIGCNLSIHNLRRSKSHGNWYGEGDEMIFVDDDNEGDRWPPTLHGTGHRGLLQYSMGASHPFRNSPFFWLAETGRR